MNLNEDATLSECLLYYIKEGLTKVGSPDAPNPQDIQLVGSHILKEHCHFENVKGVVKLVPRPSAICFVNGKKIESSVTLKTGSRVILGKNHVFRFNHPEQARELTAAQIASPSDEAEADQRIDWDFAHEELMAKQGIDLKAEMAKKLKEIEDQWRKDKEEANQAFQQERKKYEDQIESLQKQVMEQSMTMSMYSSMTPDEFNHEEDVFVNPIFEAEPCHWSDHEYELASWAFGRWRRHQFTSLRDDLWGNAVFLKEANAISVELKKRVQFQFVLLTDTLYSPLPSGEYFFPIIESLWTFSCNFNVRRPRHRSRSGRRRRFSRASHSGSRRGSGYQKWSHSLLEHRKTSVSILKEALACTLRQFCTFLGISHHHHHYAISQRLELMRHIYNGEEGDFTDLSGLGPDHTIKKLEQSTLATLPPRCVFSCLNQNMCVGELTEKLI